MRHNSESAPESGYALDKLQGLDALSG